MQITVNGESREIADGANLASFMESIGESSLGTAVAVNNKLVTKAMWDDFVITPGSDIIIIKAAYGG